MEQLTEYSVNVSASKRHHQAGPSRGMWCHDVYFCGAICSVKRPNFGTSERCGSGGGATTAITTAANVIRSIEEECLLHIKLRHPNIAQFIGVCYEDNSGRCPSLVLEGVYASLASCLESCKGTFTSTIPLPVKLTVLRDVSAGLRYLHTVVTPPIVHCNLTTSNILLTQDWRAKIANFGNSAHPPLSSTHKDPETLPYMPSSVLDGNEKLKYKLDIFSFGIIALYVAIEIPPKDADITKQSEQCDILSAKPELKSLHNVVVWCCKDDLVQRPSTSDLNDHMEQLCADNPPPFHDVVQLLNMNSVLTDVIQVKDKEIVENVEIINQLMQENEELKWKNQKKGKGGHGHVVSKNEERYWSKNLDKTVHVTDCVSSSKHETKTPMTSLNEYKKSTSELEAAREEIAVKESQVKMHQNQVKAYKIQLQQKELDHQWAKQDYEAQLNAVKNNLDAMECLMQRQLKELNIQLNEAKEQIAVKEAQVKQYQKQVEAYKQQLEESKIQAAAFKDQLDWMSKLRDEAKKQGISCTAKPASTCEEEQTTGRESNPTVPYSSSHIDLETGQGIATMPQASVTSSKSNHNASTYDNPGHITSREGKFADSVSGSSRGLGTGLGEVPHACVSSPKMNCETSIVQPSSIYQITCRVNNFNDPVSDGSGSDLGIGKDTSTVPCTNVPHAIVAQQQHSSDPQSQTADHNQVPASVPHTPLDDDDSLPSPIWPGGVRPPLLAPPPLSPTPRPPQALTPSEKSRNASSSNVVVPIDRNLTCLHCHIVFRKGEIQKFRQHVEECRNR